jgi:hypothetical protein
MVRLYFGIVTAELVVNTFSSVDGGKYSAIEEKLHHDFFPITTQQAKQIRPWAILECLNIVIRELAHNAGDMSIQGILSHSRALEAMSQQMLGLLVAIIAILIEQFPNHKINHLNEVSDMHLKESLIPKSKSCTNLRLRTSRSGISADQQ